MGIRIVSHSSSGSGGCGGRYNGDNSSWCKSTSSGIGEGRGSNNPRVNERVGLLITQQYSAEKSMRVVSKEAEPAATDDKEKVKSDSRRMKMG